MAFHFPGRTYPGAPLDDLDILDRIPVEYAQLLALGNGFVAFGGALHVRGACSAPAWHSLRVAMEGREALHERFPAVVPGDTPFGQDALGNQFLLRGGAVHRLRAADGAVNVLEHLAPDLTAFLTTCLEEPAALLPLDAVAELHAAGSRLAPGELIATTGGVLRAVPALERIRELAR